MYFTQLTLPRCQVGEGPVWDVEEQALYWIDIIGPHVHRLDYASGEVQTWEMPKIIGSMAVRAAGGVICALADGVYALDLETGETSLLASHPDLNEMVQLADGKVDRNGRFIVGSSDRSMKDRRGKVYSLEPGATQLREIDDDIALSNGPCWSLDNKTFYHADSIAKNIYAYDYDIATGDLSNRRVFASTESFGGIPDGATVDAEDHLWSAICEGGKLVRFRPDGSVERIVETPSKLPGSVMFGGAELDRLFVPTLSPAFLGREEAPEDGFTFVMDELGIHGVPEPRFGG